MLPCYPQISTLWRCMLSNKFGCITWIGLALLAAPAFAQNQAQLQHFGPAAAPGSVSGGTVTANVTNSTATATNGLNSRTLANWFGDSVNALGQNVAGDGSTNAQPTLLTASALAQSLGRVLTLPVPASSYLLNSDWKPATGDLSIYIQPGATFTGAGLPKMDNQFVHMVNPIFSPMLRSQTFGSAYSTYGNVLMNANVAINNGAGNTVSGFFEGVSNLSTTHAWGTNPVCVTVVSGATCIGEEIDTWAQVAGTNAYGLAIFMTGNADGLNGIQIGANSSSSRWLNGIDVVGANDATTSITNSVFTSSSNITSSFGLNMLSTHTSAEINTLSLRVAATPATPTSRLQIAGGNAGNSVKLSIIPNQGGSASDTVMELSAQQAGTMLLENGNGRFLQLRDPAGTIANYAYIQAALTTGQVTIGVDGTDTDVTANFRLKGAGTVVMQNGNGIIAQFTAPNASTISRLQVAAAASGGFVNLSVGGTAGNMTLGSGVLATNATTGFVGLPTTAGVPTGIVGAAGGAMILINNTSHKICHSEGGGTWYDATGAACS